MTNNLKWRNPQPAFFQAGGSLSPEIRSYIPRKADEDLYENIKANNFSYVLTARQMGKSSLKVRTVTRLLKEGYLCISIDFTKFGTSNITSALQWQSGFLYELSKELKLENEFRIWWKEVQNLAPIHIMSLFFEIVVLKNINKPTIFFFDEIDTIINLNKDIFDSNDFFAAIRLFYNNRAENASFNKINFVIFGVAAPSDLVADHLRTPFNIGVEIRLEYIKSEEAHPLYQGFDHYKNIKPKEIISEIIKITNGQPFLTQKICYEIVRNEQTIKNAKITVKHYIDKVFHSIEDNDHFINIQKQIIERDGYNIAMLNLYKKIWKNEGVLINNNNVAQIYLKLTGLVREEKKMLTISAPIYKRIFDEEWIDSVLNLINRPFSSDLKRWLEFNKSPDTALKGEVLEQALSWANSRTDLTEDEINFFKFSCELRDNEIEARMQKNSEEIKNRIAGHYY